MHVQAHYTTVRNRLPSSELVKGTVRTDTLTYMAVNYLLFQINAQKQLVNITASILLVKYEKLECIVLHTYGNSLLASHQGTSKTFLTKHRNYFIHNMLAQICIYVKACYIC